MSDNALSRVRGLCLAFPEAVEQEAWGEPTFRVKNRIVAMYASASNHHGRGEAALWCKAPLGVQELLVRSEPQIYLSPPYVGVKGWVGIRLHAVGDAELREHVVQSYCMTAPKKLQALVGDTPAAPRARDPVAASRGPSASRARGAPKARLVR